MEENNLVQVASDPNGNTYVDANPRKGYEFRCEFWNGKDTMLYEVCKPHTDLPFTTIVHEWSTKGHLPFFSALFTQTSWGLCGGDMDFLSAAWKKLGMTEKTGLPYDIDQIVQDKIKKCERGEIEPQVYRKTIEEVITMFESRGFIGVGDKIKTDALKKLREEGVDVPK